MASLLTLPDELLCLIADLYILQPTDEAYYMPYEDSYYPCVEHLAGYLLACKRTYRVLRSKLHHTITIDIPSAITHDCLINSYTTSNLLELPYGSVQHTILEWLNKEAEYTQQSLYNFFRRMRQLPCLTAQKRLTLVDFPFERLSLHEIEVLLSCSSITAITIIWLGPVDIGRRHGLSRFTSQIPSGVSLTVCSNEDAEDDDEPDASADYARQVWDYRGTSLSVYSVAGPPFFFESLKRLTHLGISPLQISIVAFSLQEANIQLTALKNLHIFEQNHGLDFVSGEDSEFAKLFPHTPSIEQCIIPLRAYKDGDVLATLKALPRSIKDLRFCARMNLKPSFLHLASYFQRGGLPNLQYFEAPSINWQAFGCYIHDFNNASVDCRKVCQNDVLDRLRLRLYDVRTVQEEIRLSEQIKDAESQQWDSYVVLAARLRSTLCYELDQRGLEYSLGSFDGGMNAGKTTKYRQLTL